MLEILFLSRDRIDKITTFCAKRDLKRKIDILPAEF